MDILDREKAKEALKEYEENEDLMIESARIMAKAMKNNYNALVEQGFSNEQAIKIIAERGIDLT